ncbi:MAG: hypothetical protein CR982_09200 [Candidatus Cloacimonadota bacterium]|nr:MAG: hypothetical protein CR982_09200 [Candidatus Cloacimonadota bacterium]PIE77533.1 MAG: hypothetical protein CSA15_12455 [Candidatus Delongbacteria bacterium]
MSLQDKVENVAKELAKKYDQEVVDVEFGNNKTGQVIRIFVGSKQGVNVNTLAAITREFNKIAELKGSEFIPYDFQLEVSSPGLDRPLKTWRDFYRNEDRDVRVTIADNDETTKTFEAKIVSASENEIVLENDKNGKFLLDLSILKKAKLIIKF